ncbi:MAG: UDP-3-O-[3-hydroxymyristoyl] N-acetylglucosamine deacetylase [Firmicutes bacterium]|nr:UDP-3-O-[3-hydroxymyristoyl] N-acetylglucosamine deacetylase [Bacillota bacterium]
MDRQTTLGRPVSVAGVGLHSGRPCRLTLCPAPADTGVRWQRIDLAGEPVIPAAVECLAGTERCTALAAGPARVQTVEHVMAALAGMGVDNALIRLDAAEPPLADGSAAEFVRLIQSAGVVSLPAPRRVRRLDHPLWVSGDGAYLIALPADRLRISYTFVTDHPALGTQYADCIVDSATFAAELAPARTVGWAAEVEALQQRGLALGGTLEAAVVVGERELLTPQRFPNEVARHKCLDILGDLALVGPFVAHIIGVRSGHRLNAELARKLHIELAEEAVDTP